MSVSRLQSTEIPLGPESNFGRDWAIIEPSGRPRRSLIQLQFNIKADDLKLYQLTLEEAYTIGSALIEHAQECGYDPVSG